MEPVDASLRLLADVLGEDLLGLYRYGSAVDGGLRPASDLDLLAVTARPMDDGERRAVVDGLSALSSPRTGVRPVDLTVVVRGDVRPWRYPPVVDLQIGEWLLDHGEYPEVPRRGATPDATIALAQVLAADSPVAGPRPADLLDPAPRDDVVRASLDGVPTLVAGLAGDRRNSLLSLARTWALRATGRMIAKDEAASWAAQQVPEELRPVLTHARRLYLGSTYDDETWPGPLEEHVTPAVDHVLARLGTEIGTLDGPPDDPVDAGPYFHGTRADLQVGDELAAGHTSNYGTRRRANFLYLAATLDAATWGAELAHGDGPGRIYLVEPTGPIEDDPNVTNARFAGNITRSFRARAPLHAVGEVVEWVGHPPARIEAMRAGLAELERQGIEAIDE